MKLKNTLHGILVRDNKYNVIPGVACNASFIKEIYQKVHHHMIINSVHTDGRCHPKYTNQQTIVGRF
jgi:hypothetical protein